MSYRLVYVTFPNDEEARRVAAQVVEVRLAACANIFPAHQSLYWWDGAVQNEQEVAAIFKTTADGYDALEAALVQAHSYDEPCVVAVPIEQGSARFLSWIENQVKTGS